MDNNKQEIKEQYIKLWDEVAPTFNEIGPNYWGEFGNRLVELSSINKGTKILDIGMGKGASLFPAIKKVDEEGKVIGIDNSEVMVRETDKIIKRQNINNAEVLYMDADKLEFDDESFDNIIGGFILAYILFSDVKFKEIKRVLKTNGQVSFSYWGVQTDQEWLSDITDKYLPNEDSEKKEDTEEKQESNKQNLNTVKGITQILQDAGFKDIQVFEEVNDVIYRDKNEWWSDMWANAVRAIFQEIKELGDNKFKQFEKDICNGLENFKKEDGKFHFNMPVIYAYGRK
ncbi:class I SAM-dependent methyltransferase [Abyssisolibacter fermentans]|uniref:class I SAM-dependent methyltransferase n=1 Tax=Abyssisolibacter fermentans TaxID=1766203 RepID=UPI00083523C0|nr:class I SAM-dependent methyltransferase [Abyssisolibacter fermentans]